MTDKITPAMALQTVGGILLTICTALAGYGLKLAIGNSERLTAIEANRFSVKDGKELWVEISNIKSDVASQPRDRGKDIEDLRILIARMSAAFEAVKPADVLREVAKLGKEIAEMKVALAQLQSLAEKVKALEVHRGGGPK